MSFHVEQWAEVAANGDCRSGRRLHERGKCSILYRTRTPASHVTYILNHTLIHVIPHWTEVAANKGVGDDSMKGVSAVSYCSGTPASHATFILTTHSFMSFHIDQWAQLVANGDEVGSHHPGKYTCLHPAVDTSTFVSFWYRYHYSQNRLCVLHCRAHVSRNLLNWQPCAMLQQMVAPSPPRGMQLMTTSKHHHW